MNTKKILVSGIVSGFVIAVVFWAFSLAAQSVFSYDAMKLGGMRDANDPVVMLFFLYPWVLSFAMTIAYAKIGEVFQGSAVWKGKKLGLLAWLLAGIPSAFLVYTSMNYPCGFTVNSVVGSLVYMIAGGITIAKLME